jgi:tRNA pseudouridine55 synthase
VFGFINLNKPEGWTSHDCVARVRRILKTKRVGHGGTLDPLATGVLPIAIGPATRLLQFLPTTKAYRATIRFGMTTTTDDLAGEIVQTQPTTHLSLDQVTQAFASFQGTIQQIPPLYSAVQVDGQRLYKLARRGEACQPAPRTVVIDQIDVLDWQPSSLYPEVTLHITCGPGTYIRAIARDLGAQLKTGGTLAQLIRTESCGLTLDQSLSLSELEETAATASVPLISPEQILSHLPAHPLDHLAAQRWCQGQAIALLPPLTHEFVRVCDDAFQLLGIGQVWEGRLVPKVVLKPVG